MIFCLSFVLPVDLYLNGHDLTLQDIEDEERKGLHYVTSGAGSKVQEDKRGLCCNKKVEYFGTEPGFATIGKKTRHI